MLPKILLVGDEEILYFLERLLERKYLVLKAETGIEALMMLQRETVQLVLSEVTMREMDGFELCRQIKSGAVYAHIPVVLLTADSSTQSKVRGLESGADVYMEQPFSREYLYAQIASLITNRTLIREYFANSPLVHIKSVGYSKSDERFLERLNEIICDNIEDAQLDVEKLARILNMSRVTLYRKIRAISKFTPCELIGITRLKKAAEFLAAGDYKIYEVADMLGFSSQSNFARNFHKQFHMTPTAYVHMKHRERRMTG